MIFFNLLLFALGSGGISFFLKAPGLTLFIAGSLLLFYLATRVSELKADLRNLRDLDAEDHPERQPEAARRIAARKAAKEAAEAASCNFWRDEMIKLADKCESEHRGKQDA